MVVVSNGGTLPPLIAAQPNYLISHSPFSVKVDRIWSGCKNPSVYSSHTTLPRFKWDVIYNAHYPLAAPNIIFAAEDERLFIHFLLLVMGKHLKVAYVIGISWILPSSWH